MFDEKSKLIEQVKDLSYEGQEKLFNLAFSHYEDKDALEIILEATDIKSETLSAAFCQAARHDFTGFAELLIADDNTDVNWKDKDFNNATSITWGVLNANGKIVDMIRGRKNFDPNFVRGNETVITRVFGYISKDSIETPEEDWKNRLLEDKRIDWNIHDDLIAKQLILEHERSEAEQRKSDLEKEITPVSDALGLSKETRGW